nr:diaminopimelate decarboxylase [Acidobacteriota bacterium]
MQHNAPEGSVLAPDWLAVPADLNELTPKLWSHDVVRGSATNSEQLSVSGIGVNELAEQFGTPLFVMSEDDFRLRARGFKDAFEQAFADVCGGV